MGSKTAVLLIGAFLLVRTAGAQQPFLSYDFETGGLEDFFLPLGVDFCGTPLPTGTADLDGGEMVIATDDIFGIGMAMLLPEVVEEKFPDSRDTRIRLRFSIDEAEPAAQLTQFALGVRARVGVDQDAVIIHSELEQAYYVSIVPEFVEPSLTDGFIAISEFTTCHEDIEHPEWPLGDGFAAAPPGFPIIPSEWYWLEVVTVGDDDGGPVQISAKLWLDGEEPPETPQLSVVDEDGLPHTDATRAPEADIGFMFGLNFDLEPRPFGATAHVDDITLTQVGGCSEPPATVTRVLWSDLVDAEGEPAAIYEENAEYEVRLEVSGLRPEGPCSAAGAATIAERIPDGWEVAEISNGGALEDGVCMWNLDLSGGVTSLTYTVVTQGSGLASFRGELADRDGDRVFFIEGAARAVDRPSLAPISDFGSIQHWLVLGPFGQAGGNNPGEIELLRDYLTDGDVTEASIMPRAGDTIEPEYFGAAASTGLVENLKGRNPGGIPTWIAWHDLDDDDDRVDFESVYGDVDNVMAYALTYLDVEEEMTVNFGISSDDSVHVLLDGDTLHANSIGRGALGRSYQDLPSQFENLREVALDPGRHTLVVKVFEGGGEHNFRIGFVDDFDLEIPGGPEGLSISIEPEDLEPEKITFRRGDANDDGAVNIADGVFILNFLFTEQVTEVPCRESTDVNDDGGINISDGLFILNYLFAGNGQAPPAPGPDSCGENPQDEDMTGCAYTSCS